MLRLDLSKAITRRWALALGLATPVSALAPAAAAAGPALRRILVLETRVAGTVHAGTRGRLDTLAADQRLILRREPENPHDGRAILVLDAAGEKLGYVPRAHNRVLAALMDQGVPLEAEISRLTPDDYECLRLRVTTRALGPDGA